MNNIHIDPKYKSRKFIIAILLIVSSTVLGLYNIMSGTDVTIVFGMVGGGYGLANVIAKKLTSNED